MPLLLLMTTFLFFAWVYALKVFHVNATPPPSAIFSLGGRLVSLLKLEFFDSQLALRNKNGFDFRVVAVKVNNQAFFFDRIASGVRQIISINVPITHELTIDATSDFGKIYREWRIHDPIECLGSESIGPGCALTHANERPVLSASEAKPDGMEALRHE